MSNSVERIAESLVGKRALLTIVTTGFGRAEVQEWRVLELSPSGNYVRLMNAYGTKVWKPTANVALVEVLKMLREPHPEARR